MKKLVLLLLTVGLLTGVFGASANPAAQSTPQSPTITSFTSSLTTVDRTALIERTARVPVSWVAVNRPIIANLFFEQVLPDGTVVNVELPRVIPWVNSSGDGMAAPIYPGDGVNQILLRVRLVNLVSGQLYSERQITLNIGTGGGTGGNNNNRPTITRFTANTSVVRGDQLASGSARVPVSWTAINRPVTTNLVFEQILSDGSVANVELPRENPWVNSVGDGVAAPVAPGGNATSIRLRVRLFDLLNGRVYDQREITLPIDNTPPGQASIRFFTSSYTSVDVNELANRTARVPVSWAVDNRPANSNLVFEQILPGGAVINVELPRTVPIVPSSGNGIAAPVLPQGASSITLTVRLVNLANNSTIQQREITLPIRGQLPGNVVVVDASQCFNAPFVGTNNIAVNGRGRALVVGGLQVLNAPLVNTVVGSLNQNETFSVLGGPYCYYLNPQPGPDQQGNFRMWRVRSESRALEGWIQEYAIGIAGVIRNIEPVTGTAPATATAPAQTGIQIRSFTANPTTVQRGGMVTLNWEVTGVQSVNVTRLQEQTGVYLESLGQTLPATGSLTYTIPSSYINTAQFVLLTSDPNINQFVTVSIACPSSSTLIANDCPVTQASVSAAYQPFENGVMVWRGDTRQIYVLFNDGTYQTAADTWVEGETFDDGRTPPEGRIAPARGFGKLWFTNSSVQQRLGWATAEEQSYSTPLETHKYIESRAEFTSTVFRLPDGRVAILQQGDRWRFAGDE